MGDDRLTKGLRIFIGVGAVVAYVLWFAVIVKVYYF